MKKTFTRLAFAALVGIAASANAQTIWQQDFEGTTGNGIPSGWSQSNAAGDSMGWRTGTGTGLSSQNFPIGDHTRIIATNDDACNCDKSKDTLKTQSFSLTGITSAYLSFDFYYWANTYQGSTESLKLLVSTNGGSTWTVLETLPHSDGYGWSTHYVNLSAYNNMANVELAWVYNDGGGWLYGAALDNVSVFVPNPIDVALTSIAPVTGDPASYNTVNNNITFSGTFFNQGSSNVTSAVITYTVDGGAPVTYNLTGINVAPFTSQNFTIPTPYTVAALGNHNVVINLSVTGDASTNNDQMTTTVVGAEFIPNHVITYEEGTGTWCGWCPRGAVFMDSIHNAYPTTIAPIAVHNNDPMTVSVYDAGVGTMISGYPSVLVDRKEVIDPSDIFTAYPNHINDFAFADLSATQTYDGASKLLTVNASAHFAVALNGDYRLALVLTEDGVHGTATTWDQHDYYSFQSQNIALSGAGHNWQNETNPVPAANMYYNFVARYISGSFNGQSGSLPSTIPSGSTQTHTFSTTLNSAWTPNNMKAIVLLIDATSGKVLNAILPRSITGINDPSAQITSLSVYPNPTAADLNVLFSLKSKQNLTIEITNVLGQVVASHNFGGVQSGTNELTLNTASLATGVYFANIKTDSGVVSRKFVKD